jgi:RimJ/RimL family protein N-acetyltransferase
MDALREPRLETERLLLRPPTLADAAVITRLANDKEVADGVLSIPHPYTQEDAEAFITRAQESLINGDGYVFAIIRKADQTFLGCMGIHPQYEHKQAEIGYWFGRAYWGQGYATETGKRIVQFGFEALDLNRIHARHFTRNPASGRVMQKMGMRYEGTLRQEILKNGEFLDTACYSILRSEYTP